MKPRQTSFAFLMEMLWVCGFFILTACIFLLAFIKADRMSLNAQNLNQAVLYTENAVEDTFAAFSAEDSKNPEQTLYFDKQWRKLETEQPQTEQPQTEQPQAAFYIKINTGYEDGMLEVSAEACDIKGDSIYSLEGLRYLSD